MGDGVLIGGGDNWSDVGCFTELLIDTPSKANSFTGSSNVSLGSSSIFGRCTTFAYFYTLQCISLDYDDIYPYNIHDKLSYGLRFSSIN